MRKPIALHTADWHLEKHAWTRYPELCGDSYYALEQAITLATTFQVPMVAAGDLFNKTLPDSKSVYVAMQQMDRMQDSNLPVYYVQGQHEMNREQPWLGLHTWPIHIHLNDSYKLGSYKMVGLDYTRRDLLNQTLNRICKPDIQILVCHQVWQEFMGHRNSDAPLSSIPNVSLVLTGDFHKHTHLRIKNAQNQDMLVLSTGSMCLQTVDEPPMKAVYLLYDDLSFESIPLKSRLIHSVTINSQADLDSLLSSIGYGMLDPQADVPENMSKPIIDVKFNPEVKSVYSDITSYVQDKAHLFLRPVNSNSNSTETQTEVSELEESQKIIDAGLNGNLIKHCAEDSYTYTTTRRLLESTNPKLELIAIETEYFEKLNIKL
jgi:hypothetical protein